jgi:hypothetical protein
MTALIEAHADEVRNPSAITGRRCNDYVKRDRSRDAMGTSRLGHRPSFIVVENFPDQRRLFAGSLTIASSHAGLHKFGDSLFGMPFTVWCMVAMFGQEPDVRISLIVPETSKIPTALVNPKWMDWHTAD